jgi:small redox-active disulfide protein 2
MKKVQVLGPGCPKCQQAAANVSEAAKALGLEVEVEKVSKPMDIAKYGVMFTPGLAVEGEVVCAGRIPSVEEIKGWLEAKPAKEQQK